MKKSFQTEKYKIFQLTPTFSPKPDDLFITCASFEERCLGLLKNNFAKDYSAQWACILKHEPDQDENKKFERDRKANYLKIKNLIKPNILKNLSTIICSRTQILDGMGQFKTLWETLWKPNGCEVVTIDITTFTKLYLFEILYFLIIEQGVKKIRAVYNQAHSYGTALLTTGVGKVICFPSYPGKFNANKETVLIACLGFETERALGIWHACEPNKTIAIIGNPPLRPTYIKRAKESNKFLLTRASVQIQYADYYDPFAMKEALGFIYKSECLDKKQKPFNTVIMPLGTKVQALGTFLFWLQHQNIRIMYAFPQAYGKAYSLRKPGYNYEFLI